MPWVKHKRTDTLRNGRRSSVPAESFVQIWMANDSVQRIAQVAGMTIDRVRTRAAYLRKKGVKLPMRIDNVSAGKKPIDVAALNAIIAAAKPGDQA